jgi:hypothetical protein
MNSILKEENHKDLKLHLNKKKLIVLVKNHLQARQSFIVKRGPMTQRFPIP